MAILDYPNKANASGFPLLEGTAAVDSTSGNLVITFQPHLAYNANWTGGFYVKIANAIATGSQPVVFATAGTSQTAPLYTYGGTQATAAELVTTTGGIILCFWDASANRLQVIGSNI